MSQLVNCYVKGRPDANQAIVTLSEDGVSVDLNGYAIVPLEQYEELLAGRNREQYLQEYQPPPSDRKSWGDYTYEPAPCEARFENISII